MFEDHRNSIFLNKSSQYYSILFSVRKISELFGFDHVPNKGKENLITYEMLKFKVWNLELNELVKWNEVLSTVGEKKDDILD